MNQHISMRLFWLTLFAAGCWLLPNVAIAQWQTRGALPVASQPVNTVVAANPTINPTIAAPLPTVVTQPVAPVYPPTTNVFGPQYAGAYIPNMPPPPGAVAPATWNSPATAYSPIQLAQATTSPPVVVGPPVAQGFGTSVAPAAPAPYLPPAPGAIVEPVPWGCPTIVPSQYVKFVQNIRLRYTWLDGDSAPNEMETNDIEGAVTFALPNFLNSQQPLLITPGFIMHLWEGPSMFPAGSLPSRVYSAYLDFYWVPRITDRLSAELDFRAGVYSDFRSASSEAFRAQSDGAFIFQTSPTLALKGGVAYINRVDIDLLPIAGVIWTPNPYTVFDITFPNPKLSHFAWRWGNTDVWWYLAGEYGGGSWEIDTAIPGPRVDINDIRLIGGLEWTGGWVGAKGFLELGYVFDREIVIQGGGRVGLDDTIMVRGGLSF